MGRDLRKIINASLALFMRAPSMEPLLSIKKMNSNFPSVCSLYLFNKSYYIYSNTSSYSFSFTFKFSLISSNYIFSSLLLFSKFFFLLFKVAAFKASSTAILSRFGKNESKA